MLPADLPPSLTDLVVTRKACRIYVARDPDRIMSAAEFSFDPEVVSHWAQWLGHPRGGGTLSRAEATRSHSPPRAGRFTAEATDKRAGIETEAALLTIIHKALTGENF